MIREVFLTLLISVLMIVGFILVLSSLLLVSSGIVLVLEWLFTVGGV